jgi:hypothetical protein
VIPAASLAPSLVEALPRAAPAATIQAPAEPGLLAITVDADAAMRLGVGRLLKVEKAALELVPIHAFRYACKLEAKGAPTISKAGLLGVDATTGNVRELPEPTFGPLPYKAERREAGIHEMDASTAAKHKIMELHTQKMHVRNSLGRGALIVEDRMVRPDPKTIQLNHEGQWWLPVWKLEGQNGSLRINAATGAIEDEKLKRAFAQDAEFL